MNHQGTIKLETNRLILRKFNKEDANAMYRNWASDDDVTKYLSWPTHANVSATRTVLDEWIQKYNDSEYYNWAVTLKENGEPIGSLSVVSYEDKTASAVLGGCLGKSWWGQRIMPEAVSVVLEYLFEVVGLNRITAKHDEEDSKSGRAIQKIGMICEGTFREGGTNSRGIVDEVHYSIQKDDYERRLGQSTKLVWKMI